MDIKLIPHVGKKEVPGAGPVDQTFAQDQVMIDGVRVGYAPHRKGAPLLLIGELPESTISAITAHLDIRDNLTCEDRKVITPPPIEEIPDLDGEDEYEDE